MSTRRIVRLLSAVVAAAGSVVAAGLAAQPAAAANPSVVQFQRVNTQLCVQQIGGNESQLVDLVCNSGVPGQRWTWLVDFGNGSKFIPQSAPVSCMNVQGASRAAGAKIVVSDCGSDLSQDWQILGAVTPGSFNLRNANSGLCVTIALGGLLVQQQCDSNAANQSFFLLPR